MGRPHKYQNILKALEPDTLYIPSTIAHFAEDKGLLPPAQSEDTFIAKRRIRITMGRLSNNRGFPDEGDGHVKKTGQRPIPGWFGWRWQTVLAGTSLPKGDDR